jgi:oleate hydratase
MSEPTVSPTRSAPQAHEPVRVEADAYGFTWRNTPESRLPPPDLISSYNRNKPLARAGVEKRKATIVGSGIAGLAAAFYLIRDGHMPGRNITILDSVDVAGGSLDGAGDAETGYILRGGREMCFTYENFWDLFQDVPALELPEGYSVLDEYRLLNDSDPTYSKARLMHRQGQIKDFSTFGLSRSQQWELTRLLFMRKEEIDDITVEQYFSKGLLESNFWVFWRTMFAFQNWHSLLEMKLYMHRFLDLIDGLHDLSSLVYSKYNQYDSFVRPLIGWLSDKGVQIQFNTRVDDLALETEGERKTVTRILCTRDGKSDTIPVGPEDIVIALTGSMTEGTAYGDLDTVPALTVDRRSPAPESGWTLWRNLAAKSPAFGKPEKFYGDVDRSIWESATLTCKPSPLTEKLKELAVNDPYSGKVVTGGIITFTVRAGCSASRATVSRTSQISRRTSWSYGPTPSSWIGLGIS